MSLGVASPDESMYAMEDLLKKSDERIYEEKIKVKAVLCIYRQTHPRQSSFRVKRILHQLKAL
jgi:hypothetical protein